MIFNLFYIKKSFALSQYRLMYNEKKCTLSKNFNKKICIYNVNNNSN